MEGVLLPLFQCQVSVPTRYDFAMRFCEQAQLTSREKSLVTLLLELSFLDYNLNYFLPSKVAAGAMHLAMQVFSAVHSFCGAVHPYSAIDTMACSGTMHPLFQCLVLHIVTTICPCSQSLVSLRLPCLVSRRCFATRPSRRCCGPLPWSA